MNKEQLFENLDYQEGDKIYIVRIREAPEGTLEQRTNHNFNIYEILGLAKRMEREMYKFFEGNLNADVDITERIILKDEKIKGENTMDITKEYTLWCCSCGKSQPFSMEFESDCPDLICDVCHLVIATLKKK